MIGLTKVTRQGWPLSSKRVSPTWIAAMVAQPSAVTSGVSTASALPTCADDIITTLSTWGSEIASMMPR
jgi:hypothetical protein